MKMKDRRQSPGFGLLKLLIGRVQYELDPFKIPKWVGLIYFIFLTKRFFKLL